MVRGAPIGGLSLLVAPTTEGSGPPLPQQLGDRFLRASGPRLDEGGQRIAPSELIRRRSVSRI